MNALTSRTITFLLPLTLGSIVLMLWAYGSNQPTAEIPITATPLAHSTPSASEGAVKRPTLQSKEIGETLELEIATLTVTIHEIRRLAQVSEGNKHIVVDLTIENTKGTVIDLYLFRIFVKDSEGVYYIADFLPPEFESGTTLQAQKRIRGRVLFQVPTTATGLSLEIFGLQPNGVSGPYFTIAIP